MRSPVAMSFAGYVVVGFLGLFVLGMAWMFKAGVRNVWRGYVSSRWPTTEGVVSRVETTKSTTRDSRGKSSTMYGADVVINYSTGQGQFTTDQVRWGQTLGSSDASEAMVLALRYPEGRRVTVHYNPSKPSEAVVKPGLTAGAFLLPGAALVFLLVLVPACFEVWRYFQKEGVGLSASSPFFWTIRGLLCMPILFGVAMVWGGVGNLKLGSQSNRWPTVSGKWITDTQTAVTLEKEELESHPGYNFVYVFDAAGETRYNNVRWFGQGTATGNDAEADIARHFPRGQPLTVHHHPIDPDIAVLSPGVRGFAWILPGIGIAFLLFGIIGLLVSSRV